MLAAQPERQAPFRRRLFVLLVLVAPCLVPTGMLWANRQGLPAPTPEKTAQAGFPAWSVPLVRFVYRECIPVSVALATAVGLAASARRTAGTMLLYWAGCAALRTWYYSARLGVLWVQLADRGSYRLLAVPASYLLIWADCALPLALWLACRRARAWRPGDRTDGTADRELLLATLLGWSGATFAFSGSLMAFLGDMSRWAVGVYRFDAATLPWRHVLTAATVMLIALPVPLIAVVVARGDAAGFRRALRIVLAYEGLRYVLLGLSVAACVSLATESQPLNNVMSMLAGEVAASGQFRLLPLPALIAWFAWPVVARARDRAALGESRSKCGYSLVGNVSGRCPECGVTRGGRLEPRRSTQGGVGRIGEGR